MPELPEVECLTRAVRAALRGGKVVEARFLRSDLRGEIPIKQFREIVCALPVEDVRRRSKYLLLKTAAGFGVFHFGMTGNLIIHSAAEPQAPHTHAVFRAVSRRGKEFWLHFTDPRRFGRIGCVAGHDLKDHRWFAQLGPEPLKVRDLGAHLLTASRPRRQPVKSFLMDAGVVVGVGNIYASEALFRAGIRPTRAAQTLTAAECRRLALAITRVLKQAIAAGGTSFRDYRHVDGSPGYFKVRLNVYERAGEPCRRCGNPICQARQAGRSTFFCQFCQS